MLDAAKPDGGFRLSCGAFAAVLPAGASPQSGVFPAFFGKEFLVFTLKEGVRWKGFLFLRFVSPIVGRFPRATNEFLK